MEKKNQTQTEEEIKALKSKEKSEKKPTSIFDNINKNDFSLFGSKPKQNEDKKVKSIFDTINTNDNNLFGNNKE